MQFTSAVVLAVATAVSAAPLAERAQNALSLISARSGSPVHLLPISARGLSLWVGGNTSTYCPSEAGVDCSSYKNYTAFGGQEGNPTSLGMSTTVPGGQLVYIAPGGAVKYTQAHSASMPAGSVVQGFNYYSDANNKYVSPVANGSTGFLACPATAAEKETGPWQLFAAVTGVQVPSGCEDDCYGIDAVGSTVDGPVAWQYA